MAPFFGFHMPNYTSPGIPDDRLFDHVVEQARAAEAAGFDLVTVMDHLYQIRGIGPETDPMLREGPALRDPRVVHPGRLPRPAGMMRADLPRSVPDSRSARAAPSVSLPPGLPQRAGATGA